MVRYEKEILDYVQKHPGCSNFDLIKGVHGVLVGVDADQMVVNGKLDCWYTKKEPTYYIPGTHTLSNVGEPSKEHEKIGNKCITAYLDAFDEFCDEARMRYDEDVISDLTPEAMINLYRGFIAATGHCMVRDDGESSVGRRG